MTKQNVWFKTDLGYYATRKLIHTHSAVLNGFENKGRYTFYLKDRKDITFQITTKGKLGIYYPKGTNYEIFLDSVKPLLIRPAGAPAEKFEVTTEPIELKKLDELIEEADPKIVKNIINVIRNEKIESVLLRRINELGLLSWKKRVAHYPEVRSVIKERLEDPKVMCNPEIFKELVYTLAIVVDFEQRNKSPDSRELIEELVDDNFTLIATVIDSNPKFLGYRTLFFLGRSGKKEAVEIVFKLMKNNPEKALREIENLGFALGKQNLYEKHQLLIDDQIDDLMRSHKEIFNKVAKKLDEIIRKRM